ncbi:MAG: hypothetical protein K6B43_05925 [Treponema sp.]|nr:hypothetical protein [Treponema sp.]
MAMMVEWEHVFEHWGECQVVVKLGFSHINLLILEREICQLTQAEFERSQIERLISSRVANFDCNIQDLLDDYENTGNGMDALEKQFFLFACAICENRNKNLETTSFDLLISAIRQTFPNYEIDTDFSNRFLTVFELMILNNIALCLYDNGNKKDAIDLLLRVEKQFYIQEIESIVAVLW